MNRIVNRPPADPQKEKSRKARRKQKGASLLKGLLEARLPAAQVPSGLLKFSFAYSCDDPAYGLADEKHLKDGLEAQKARALYICLQKISLLSWNAFEQLGKFRGGPESLPVSMLRSRNLLQKLEQANLADEVQQVLSIRFGQEQYRLICWRTPAQPDVLYVLGADWHHSLYDHGA